MGGRGPCYLCAEESGLRCPHCGVWVCGEAHYRHHRQPAARSLPLVSADSLEPLLEDQGCAPFRVQRDADRGRYLVATRDIRPLELVFRWYFMLHFIISLPHLFFSTQCNGNTVLSSSSRDTPLVVAPPALTPPVCLECLAALVPGHVSSCPGCHAPVLCDTCVPALHLAECDVIRRAGVGARLGLDRTANHILYTCILPLRMWRLQHTQPEAWDQINFLQEDNSQSFSSQAVWRDVAEYIHNTLGVTDFTTREIIRLCSIKVIVLLHSTVLHIDAFTLFMTKY